MHQAPGFYSKRAVVQYSNRSNIATFTLHPLHIIQKRSIRICQKADYRSHSRPLFYLLKTLNIHDMVNFKSMVFMYRVYNKLLPANIMSYFKKISMPVTITMSV